MKIIASDEGAISGHAGKNYILTCDLGQKISYFANLGLKVPGPNSKLFQEIETELASKIGQALGGVRVIALNMEQLAANIIDRAYAKSTELKDAIVISSCPEIAVNTDINIGRTLEINRIVNFQGKMLGIGPRPGHLTIDDQIEIIRSVYGKTHRPIIIVEDGSYSGRTLSKVLKEFKANGLQIKAVVVGFIFAEAKARLLRELDGDLIVINEIESPVDWVADHDFFPFVPNCGRMVGTKVRKNYYPFVFNQAFYTVPYILPFGPIYDWANIPKEKSIWLSDFCLQETIFLFEELARLNRRQLTIGDLIGLNASQKKNVAVSIPIGIWGGEFPALDTKVIEFLADAKTDCAVSHSLLYGEGFTTK